MTKTSFARACATAVLIASSAACTSGSDEAEPVATTNDALNLAGKKIAVNESIAGVKLGMRASEVKGLLGRPNAIRKELDGALSVYRYNDAKPGAATLAPRAGGGEPTDDSPSALDISLFDGRVVTVAITTEKILTADGLGVGSSKSEIRARYPNASCDRFYCEMSTDDGKTVTNFRFVDESIKGQERVETRTAIMVFLEDRAFDESL